MASGSSDPDDATVDSPLSTASHNCGAGSPGAREQERKTGTPGKEMRLNLKPARRVTDSARYENHRRRGGERRAYHRS
ncbi:hypothetical protein E2562_027533 [Oryza meyeriana var. granulata]|uniref:Uncharacterized protein n=1 Tax=Oryza meyeriana var. granulata TaxID=110450 RepID=A0A6G1CK75_9ORYZ|nr:hypothetical protein E2562_027533 [Oryza meyeriana var. granulata]